MGAKKSTMLSSACMVMMITILLVSSVSAMYRPKDPKDGEFLPCLGAWGSVISCEGFMTGQDAQPAGECCDTLQGLDSEAMRSEADQISVCQCFEDAVAGLTVNPDKLTQLVQMCGTSYLPNDINFDCTSL